MRLQDFRDVSEATDIASLESLLVKFASDLDFGIISGALVIEQPAGRSKNFHFGNTPAAFSDSFSSTAIGQRDPVMRRLKRLSAPFVYDQQLYVGEEAADLWDAQASFGYKTGIAMALHMPGGKHFIMGVDREESLPSNDVLLTRMMADLQLLAVHAQEAAVRLLATQAFGIDEMPSLTPREVEILRWTHEGKSAWSVGQILGISEHAVKYHVNKTLIKLGVASKHQAAAKAKALGLI